MQNGECKFVRVPEGDYLRLVSEAKQNGEREFPFTLDELYQLTLCVGSTMGGLSNPLYKKLLDMFEKESVRQR